VTRAQQSAWRFGVTVERTGDTALLKVAGRFGHKATPEFERAAQTCLDSNVSGIVIDLAGADYLSSPGLRAIVALATKMEERKGQVIVRGARDAVRVTLGLADFTKTKQGKRLW
jgi:anti-sigma B factor antagonist